jgi:hypothetical protein
MKKLLLILSFLGVYFHAESQYTAGTMYPDYYDISPDTLLNYVIFPYTNESLFFDLFDDAATDIEIRANGAVSSGGTSAYINVIPLNPNLFVRWGRYDSVYIPAYNYWDVSNIAKPLAAGDLINAPGAIWSDSMAYITDHSGWGGGNKNVNDWIGGDRYIGLKYQNGSSVAYGWIRVECVSEDSCYVKDYSIAPLILGINETLKNESFIFPNPMTGVFYLKNPDANLKASDIILTDIYGKRINFRTQRENASLRIETETIPSGCYFLQYKSGESFSSQKVIKLDQ